MLVYVLVCTEIPLGCAIKPVNKVARHLVNKTLGLCVIHARSISHVGL